MRPRSSECHGRHRGAGPPLGRLGADELGMLLMPPMEWRLELEEKLEPSLARGRSNLAVDHIRCRSVRGADTEMDKKRCLKMLEEQSGC